MCSAHARKTAVVCAAHRQGRNSVQKGGAHQNRPSDVFGILYSSFRLISTHFDGLEYMFLDGFFCDRSLSRHEGLEMSVDLRSAAQCDCG